jgi:hypothetical protein
VLFRSLLLEEPARVGVALSVVPGQAFARQPCAALQGTTCTFYEQRPVTCRRYRCLLLEAHEAGEVSLGGAIEIVEQVKGLRARVAAELGETPGGAVVELARRTQPPPVTLEALERQVAFHFLGQRHRQR